MRQASWLMAWTLVLAVCGGVHAEPGPAGSASVRVVIEGVRNQRGGVGCLLFAAAKGFPEEVERAYRSQRVRIANGRAECVFTDLPAATYAVMTLHDENGNGKMDKSFIGAPREGYGPSNNVTHALSAPRWEEAKFTLKADADLTIQIRMKY